MRKRCVGFFSICCASLGLGALVVSDTAYAGGFSIREQSSLFMGSAFAGNAAGGDLSSMFWNPAALATVPGTNSASHAAVIFPDTEITITDIIDGSGAPVMFPSNSGNSGNIGDPALVPSSYFGHQYTNYNPKLFFGVATNSPFGLVTKPENTSYAGSVLARKSSIFNININPMMAYQVTPGIAVGVGVQASFMEGILKFATGEPDKPSTVFDGNDIAFGGTAGLILKPSSATTIGIGYRSTVSHTLEGTYENLGLFPSVLAKADLDLPEIVTVSIQHALSPSVRLMGTFEWTNWSRLEQLQVVAQSDGLTAPAEELDLPAGYLFAGDVIATIPVNWGDGYFGSVGGEYDYSDRLTLRGGAAYEKSPVKNAKQRIANVPDSDRIWLSAGATYKWSDNISFDLAYTHIFFEDGDIEREDFSGNTYLGEVENATDIVAVSFKYKWAGGPAPLK